jgi:dipeptide/tripeptide permease
VAAARDVSAWQGTSFLTPLVGAFIADSFLGKYWTALIFSTIFIIVSDPCYNCVSVQYSSPKIRFFL